MPPPADRTPDVRDADLEAGELLLTTALELEHWVSPDGIATALERLAPLLDATDLTVYLVDHNQLVLTALPSTTADPKDFEVDGTIGGRAFQTEALVHGASHGERTEVWVPIKDGAERLGVLRATVAVDDVTVRRLRALATVVAAMVVSRRQYGDALLLARRRRPMTLAAEMRWSMLPPLTYTGPAVTIAGILEPAYEIAGDTFDYGVLGDDVHLCVLDAMGHGLEASVMVSLAVSSYRHSRRSGLSLEDTADAMDAAVASQFPGEQFVTAQMATLEASTGRLSYVCCGHPAPMLVRNHRVIGDLAVTTAPPIGLGLARPVVLTADLEPGDRLLFLSDGAIEARSPDGDLFGRTRLGELLSRAVASGLPASEVMRRMMHALLEHQRSELQDDATLLLLEWPEDQRAEPGA